MKGIINMLKEITHEKAIEVLKSGGEIVVKRDYYNQPNVKYKIDNNCLVWTTEYKWHSTPTRSLAEFLSKPVYIEGDPIKTSKKLTKEQLKDLTLLEIVKIYMSKDFAEASYKAFKVEFSSEEFKEITAIKAIENTWKDKNVYSKGKTDIIIRKCEFIDSLTVSSLNNYIWYELQKTTSTHEATYPSGFNLLVPTNILFGKEITITIEEIE